MVESMTTEDNNPGKYSRANILAYLSTRFSSLAPPKNKPIRRNPFKVARQVTTAQWLMFLCGVLGRAWDAFGYSTVTITVTELGKQFHAPASSVSWAITATLMTRPVGAVIFGTCCDRYGRKWPMIANLLCLLVLEMASGFCTSLRQFIAVRSLYGIAMGGLMGPAAAIALEDLPPDARGVLSGLFEGGTSLGSLLSSSIYRALIHSRHGWRSIYWFGAGPPIIIIIFRWWLPETQQFQRIKAEREAKARARRQQNIQAGITNSKATELRIFLHDAWKAIRENWVLLLYMFLLMAGFNACSHGAIDLYPTFLKNQVGMSADKTSLITIMGSLGSLCGGITIGYVSGFAGRRLTMMCTCVVGAAILPAYILPRGMVLGASIFFMHFAIIGSWGPIPIHLVELAPQTLRTLFLGFTYQLGVLASSPMTTGETYYGEKFPLHRLTKGTKRYDYGRAIVVFVAVAWAYMFVLLLLGPESGHGDEQEGLEVQTSPYMGGMDSEPQSPTDTIEKGPVVCEAASGSQLKEIA